jgi:cell wall-associated NlpC family hydrolase
LVGLQYRFGGEDIDGFDCSGLVSYVYDCYGYKIPRTAKRQSKLKKKIKLRRAKPGDIVIFKIKRNRWHTGLYIGDNEFIHAPNRKAKVRKERLNKYWRKRLKHAVSMLPMH